jgi:hypothetical protein
MSDGHPLVCCGPRGLSTCRPDRHTVCRVCPFVCGASPGRPAPQALAPTRASPSPAAPSASSHKRFSAPPASTNQPRAAAHASSRRTSLGRIAQGKFQKPPVTFQAAERPTSPAGGLRCPSTPRPCPFVATQIRIPFHRGSSSLGCWAGLAAPARTARAPARTFVCVGTSPICRCYSAYTLGFFFCCSV